MKRSQKQIIEEIRECRQAIHSYQLEELKLEEKICELSKELYDSIEED